MSQTITIVTSTEIPSPACNCPPSPTPPWAREPHRISRQVLTDAGTIDITKQITLLEQTVASDPPYAVALPDGTYVGQSKQIMIPADTVAASATWLVTGTFIGYTQLQFDPDGHNALLFWDGTGWTLLGNATQVS